MKKMWVFSLKVLMFTMFVGGSVSIQSTQQLPKVSAFITEFLIDAGYTIKQISAFSFEEINEIVEKNSVALSEWMPANNTWAQECATEGAKLGRALKEMGLTILEGAKDTALFGLQFLRAYCNLSKKAKLASILTVYCLYCWYFEKPLLSASWNKMFTRGTRMRIKTQKSLRLADGKNGKKTSTVFIKSN